MRDRVVAAYRNLLQAWNSRDAETFASFFADDGDAVGFDGSAMHGRSEIGLTLAAVFQNERTGFYVARVLDTRELGSGVVLLRSIVGMIPPHLLDLQLDLDLAVSAVQSVVFRQDGDELKIALLQSTPMSFSGRPEVADALMEELEKMLQGRPLKH